MTDWLARAAKLIGDKEPLVLVTVCGAEGSAPREAGAKMLVTAETFSGTIGGGALEYSAIARAREMLGEGADAIAFDDFPLGPALGQCCGGRVRIGYERLCADDLEWIARAGAFSERGEAFVLERSLAAGRGAMRRASRCDADASKAGALAFLDAGGAEIAAPMPPLEQCAGFREIIADSRAHVYVFGAGHVGSAIVAILQTMPAAVTWIDRRAECFPGAVGDNVSVAATDDETGLAAAAPAGACCFVLTHSHQLDYDLVHAILRRGDSAYCGLIGSRTKRARFERRLRRAGVDEASLAHLSCPLGAGGLEGKSPAIIALTAVHEMFLAHQAHERGQRN